VLPLSLQPAHTQDAKIAIAIDTELTVRFIPPTPLLMRFVHEHFVQNVSRATH
jgi:hypothetical protein